MINNFIAQVSKIIENNANLVDVRHAVRATARALTFDYQISWDARDVTRNKITKEIKDYIAHCNIAEFKLRNSMFGIKNKVVILIPLDYADAELGDNMLPKGVKRSDFKVGAVVKVRFGFDGELVTGIISTRANRHPNYKGEIEASAYFPKLGSTVSFGSSQVEELLFGQEHFAELFESVCTQSA